MEEDREKKAIEEKKAIQDKKDHLVEEIKDSLLMKELISDLFEEDQVTHKHGGTEPERD
jgi:hypothetical protein